MLRPDNKKRSKLQEAKAAKDFGGLTTPGSGNQWHSKGDVKTPTLLIECKTTSKDSYTLKASTWSKIRTEAILESRDPIMEIVFIDRGVELIVADKEDYLALAERNRELQEQVMTLEEQLKIADEIIGT